MEELSYIASFISIILGLFEPFGKKMRTVLTLSLLGNVCVGISYLLIQKYSGAIVCATAAIQLIINYCYSVRDKKLPKTLIAVHLVSFLAVNLITFAAWYDLLALVASLLFVLSVAQENAKHYRLLYVSNSLVWIFYDIVVGAYGNLATHVILFIATIIAVVYRDVALNKTKQIKEDI